MSGVGMSGGWGYVWVGWVCLEGGYNVKGWICLGHGYPRPATDS